MASGDPALPLTLQGLAYSVVIGVTVALLVRLLTRPRIVRRLVRAAPAALPFVVGFLVAGGFYLGAPAAVMTIHALTTGSGILTGDDAELLAAVDGPQQCQHKDPQEDAVAELSCKLPEVEQTNIYRFRGPTHMSAWFERFTNAAKDGEACVDGGRSSWTFEGQREGGELGCTSADGKFYLRWTNSGTEDGGQLIGSSGTAALVTAWEALAFDTARGSDEPTCQPTSTVDWDNSGAGHDRWGSTSLHLSHVAACTTVMVSSAAFEVPGAASCNGGPDRVCVLVWLSSQETELQVDGLAAPGSWWSFTSATPGVAIADKSDLFNPRGWFGSRNCTTPAGCVVAEVWIVNDGAVTVVEVDHP